MDRRVTKTKEAIKEAYFRLLKTKGDEKISVAEIAREADIDRKTFYLHYESTDQIISEFAEQMTHEMLRRLTARSFFRLSFDREIFAQEANKMLTENMELAKVLSRNPSLTFFWKKVEDSTVQILVDNYLLHSLIPESEISIQVSFFVGGAAAVYQRWFRGEIECTLEEASEKVSQIAFQGAKELLKGNKTDRKTCRVSKRSSGKE